MGISKNTGRKTICFRRAWNNLRKKPQINADERRLTAMLSENHIEIPVTT
ncbi:MAG: hypothetical protein MPEBLZ_02349 [Candidatus Methanoperedens nitroreducens]|uniref:Uncharacterized protein n=1 Tax=Candidatus Methanoperedens nitratireducens TaxID=1392998 RepID=A0A0N8KQU2_9EURY|nr:MAG: hypothetical protein MPEBLZ_02349 [Candidatus Methanoperedens sp. BLZ1]CAG0972229.1 hypothetical protein METP2_01462 [Methanosarcinales archaeon]